MNVKPYDSWFYEEHLKDFVPDTFIDCYTHIWLDEQNHFCEDNANRSCVWPNMVAHNNSVEDLNAPMPCCSRIKRRSPYCTVSL